MAAWTIACGAPRQAPPADDVAPSSTIELQLQRCEELQSAVEFSARTRNADFMLTAYYAYRDNLDACLDAVSALERAPFERDRQIVDLHLGWLEAIRVASNAARLQSDRAATCVHIDRGRHESVRIYEDIERRRQEHAHIEAPLEAQRIEADAHAVWFETTWDANCTGAMAP